MNCIICKEWGKCLVDLDIINQELEAFPMTNRFGIHCEYYRPDYITPKQYEERTGEKWPDKWAVYWRWAKGAGSWNCGFYQDAKTPPIILLGVVSRVIVCATEAGPPPDNWRPEEGKERNDT